MRPHHLKRRLPLLLVSVLAFAAGICAQTSIDSKKSIAWELGSKLSLAAILSAETSDRALVERQFALATGHASKLGIRLPPMPKPSGTKAEDRAASLHYLLSTTGNPIGAILREDFGAETAAIFEIALKSNILLMLYGPGDKETTAIAGVIRSRSGAANLPSSLTEKLLSLIDQQASYDLVKAELFDLHKVAPLYIAVTDYSERGENAYTNKDYAASAELFSKALEIDPSGPEHYFSRGRAYLQMGKNLEAIADYTKVLQLQRTSETVARNLPLVYHNRGLCYGLLGRYPLAIADLTQAIKLRPDYASAYKVRSIMYAKTGNARAAAADMAKAEELQPGISR
jgi:tetratricopeptide (TPR) repeat protein